MYKKMIEDAKAKGLIKEDTIIVEPTSGNQGIGLALVGAVRGYKTKIIMPDSVSEERRKLVSLYLIPVTIHPFSSFGISEPFVKKTISTPLISMGLFFWQKSIKMFFSDAFWSIFE